MTVKTQYRQQQAVFSSEDQKASKLLAFSGHQHQTMLSCTMRYGTSVVGRTVHRQGGVKVKVQRWDSSIALPDTVHET